MKTIKKIGGSGISRFIYQMKNKLNYHSTFKNKNTLRIFSIITAASSFPGFNVVESIKLFMNIELLMRDPHR